MHRLFASLVAVLFGDFMEALRKMVRRVVTQPILMEIRKMADEIQDASDRNAQKVTDAVNAAITKEVGDVKALILAGQTAKAVAALDALGDRIAGGVAAAIDTISDAAGTEEPQPEG